MTIWFHSDCRHWSRVESITNRTAGCGPACPVVWEGWWSDPPPYPNYTNAETETILLDGHKGTKHLSVIACLPSLITRMP